MNSLTNNFLIGTFGELLVQLRLLQYEVQAAPPIKDSGNDLIAIKAEIFKAIQVKTTGSSDKITFDFKELSKRKYDILALVFLDEKESDEPNALKLDKCKMYLINNSDVKKWTYKSTELSESGYELRKELIDNIFK